MRKLDVQVCECSDGEQFTDELDALLHEVQLAFRGDKDMTIDGVDWRVYAARQLVEYAERVPRKPDDANWLATMRRASAVQASSLALLQCADRFRDLEAKR